jgi:uncharacterized protein (DUF2252 family)
LNGVIGLDHIHDDVTSAVVMASDLAKTPATGLDVVLRGDAHLSNFGVFATPERSVGQALGTANAVVNKSFD